MELCEIVKNYHLDETILSPILYKLNQLENEGKQFFPVKRNIFKAFSLFPYNDLKVVMIGQDPYPQPEVATGILFGNKPGTEKLSPSLELVKDRVYKDLYLPGPYNSFDCSLENWARQGILMINSSLTVEPYRPGSHVSLWEPFIVDLLTKLSLYNSGIIYVLFGSQAISYEKHINSKLNYVLKYRHPAYFARLDKEFECDAFLKINQILDENHGTKIQF